MACYRCGRSCSRDVMACPECGCVAFVNGLRPSWPPTFTVKEPTRHFTGDYIQQFGAFLLGPIPKAPRLALRVDDQLDRPQRNGLGNGQQ